MYNIIKHLMMVMRLIQYTAENSRCHAVLLIIEVQINYM